MAQGAGPSASAGRLGRVTSSDRFDGSPGPEIGLIRYVRIHVLELGANSVGIIRPWAETGV